MMAIQRHKSMAPGVWPGTRTGLLSAFLFVLTAAVYSNTLLNGFVYDDTDLILRNQWIRGASHLFEIFTSSIGSFLPNVVSGTYRPMVHVVYMGGYSLFGLNPAGYHLINVMLASAVTVLVFAVSLKLFRMGRAKGEKTIVAFAAAFYFAVHPAHTEAVAWVSTTAELSFTLLLLLGFYMYTDAEGGEGGEGGLAGPLLSALIFFVALLFKETALVLPLIIFVYDISMRKGRWKARIPSYIPYAAAAAIYFVLRTYAIKTAIPAMRSFDLTYYQYFINIFQLIPLYFSKLLVPINLNAYYYIEPVRSILEPRAMLSVLFTAVLITALLRLFRYDRLLFFSLAWVVVSVLPTLYLPGLGRSFFAERYLFLPSVGFALFMAALADRIIELRPGILEGLPRALFLLLLAVASVFLIEETVRRNAVWRSEYSLWTDTVKKSPKADLPRYNLGIVYAEAGRVDDAVSEFREAIRNNPGYVDAYYNLGVMYERKGLVKNAMEMYQETLRREPGSADARLNLGVLYMKEGLYDAAATEFEAALALNPGMTTAGEYLERIRREGKGHGKD